MFFTKFLGNLYENIYDDLIYFDVMRSMYYYSEANVINFLDFKRTFILGYDKNISMTGKPNTEEHWNKVGMMLYKIGVKK